MYDTAAICIWHVRASIQNGLAMNRLAKRRCSPAWKTTLDNRRLCCCTGVRLARIQKSDVQLKMDPVFIIPWRFLVSLCNMVIVGSYSNITVLHWVDTIDILIYTYSGMLQQLQVFLSKGIIWIIILNTYFLFAIKWYCASLPPLQLSHQMCASLPQDSPQTQCNWDTLPRWHVLPLALPPLSTNGATMVPPYQLQYFPPTQSLLLRSVMQGGTPVQCPTGQATAAEHTLCMCKVRTHVYIHTLVWFHSAQEHTLYIDPTHPIIWDTHVRTYGIRLYVFTKSTNNIKCNIVHTHNTLPSAVLWLYVTVILIIKPAIWHMASFPSPSLSKHS